MDSALRGRSLNNSSFSNYDHLCPYCPDMFTNNQIMLVHIICKHTFEYNEIRSTTADEMCEKLPCAKGTYVERKMRKEEAERNNPAQEQNNNNSDSRTLPESNITTDVNHQPMPDPTINILTPASIDGDATCNGTSSVDFQSLSFPTMESSLVASNSRSGDGIQNNSSLQILANISNCIERIGPIVAETPAMPELVFVNNLAETPCLNIGADAAPILFAEASPIHDFGQNMSENQQLLLHRSLQEEFFQQTSSPVVPNISNRQNGKKRVTEDSTKSTMAKKLKPIAPKMSQESENKLLILYGSTCVSKCKVVLCLCCLEPFGSAEDVFTHETHQHGDLNRFLCPVIDATDRYVCGMVQPPPMFSHSEMMFSHMSRVHPHADPRSDRWTMKCHWCYRRFNEVYAYQRHIEAEYRDRRLALLRETLRHESKTKCKNCKASFMTKKAWYEHRATQCFANEPEAEENRRRAAEQHMTFGVLQRQGCQHNKIACAFYPTCCGATCSYAHPICPQDKRCTNPACVDDHSNRVKHCHQCPRAAMPPMQNVLPIQNVIPMQNVVPLQNALF